MNLVPRVTLGALATLSSAFAQQTLLPLKNFETLPRPNDKTYQLTIIYQRASTPGRAGTFEPAALTITARTTRAYPESIANTRFELIQVPADKATVTWRASMPAKGDVEFSLINLPENGRRHYTRILELVDGRTKPLKITVRQKADGTFDVTSTP